ncbi:MULTISPECIES: hypothetical protein [Psychrilyobacter]|uniref:hypothetical protein n=1 Tax=Psychrilyobacter TaxID=623282 RepID=UPI0018F2DB32|nr:MULTISPECIES: hypothetical protein [Psychrilyobacter]MCS5422902.1 hypothetical protein [Psychrilyobacter sp. S5]
MKKLIAVLAVVVSAGAFAQDNSAPKINQGASGMQGNNMMSQMNSLTLEQQKEFNEMKTTQMVKNKKVMLDIKEINIKIQKEQIAEKPNQKKIGQLIDKKSKLQAQQQKDSIKFNIDVKEKFGIEMMGDKSCKMMGKMKDVKGMKSGKMKNMDSDEMKNIKNG